MEKGRSGLAALSGLDDPVRSLLYEFVSGSPGPVGRDEAAAAAGVGRALAAYHLDKLVGLGLLTASYQRPLGRTGRGAGRPAKVYIRSAREFAVTVPPREYELAARLLAQAVESDSGGSSRAALQAAARRHGTELGKQHRVGYAERGSAGRGNAEQSSAEQSSAEQDMQAALRARGFEPYLDQTGTIRLRNCPFHQVAIRHPDLICGMNLALVEGLAAGLGSGPGPGPGASGLRPALDPGHGRCCVVISQDQPA